jgi:hypothetical protein
MAPSATTPICQHRPNIRPATSSLTTRATEAKQRGSIEGWSVASMGLRVPTLRAGAIGCDECFRLGGGRNRRSISGGVGVRACRPPIEAVRFGTIRGAMSCLSAGPSPALCLIWLTSPQPWLSTSHILLAHSSHTPIIATTAYYKG